MMNTDFEIEINGQIYNVEIPLEKNKKYLEKKDITLINVVIEIKNKSYTCVITRDKRLISKQLENDLNLKGQKISMDDWKPIIDNKAKNEANKISFDIIKFIIDSTNHCFIINYDNNNDKPTVELPTYLLSHNDTIEICELKLNKIDKEKLKKYKKLDKIYENKIIYEISVKELYSLAKLNN